MNDNQKLICGIFILLCLGLIGAMEASIHVNSEDVIERHKEPVNINGDLYVLDPYFTWTVGEPEYYSNYTESNDTIFVNDNDVYMEVSPHTITEKKETEDILLEHNFSNWSVEDQRLLAEMMRVTARQMSGASDISEFSVLAEAAPGHVLEAYIDLLENLGY